MTKRDYQWPIPPHNDKISSHDGRVIEILSEHTIQGWLQGYLLTGRHGLFPSYEAFLNIVVSMMDQFSKFLKMSLEIPWRLPPVASLNYFETSTLWRQEHNGFSHQSPGPGRAGEKLFDGADLRQISQADAGQPQAGLKPSFCADSTIDNSRSG